MKKILLLALPLMVMCAVSCEKDKEKEEEVWTDDSPIIQFKDPRFLEAILINNYDNEGNSIDRNGDGQISEKEASLVTVLILDDCGIRGIDEIRYFTALTSLSCYYNQLTSLDVSKNTALTKLSCAGNQLTSLDLSNNTALTRLECLKNQLTSLDLHNNRLLEDLFISGNPLQKLILYKYHIINDSDMEDIESEYGDIIEYVE